MLDLRRLRTLRAVAVHGSISAAARSLSFTPSAVSQQLARLEEEAGVRLLERGPSSVRLTEAGRVLAEHTERLLADLREAETAMRTAARPDEGGLRVATFPSAAATLVPSALKAFASSRPAVPIRISETDPVTGAAGVRVGDYDVALGWEYDHVPVAVDAGLERTHLVDDPIHVLLAPDHPAAAAPEIDLAELAASPWITSTRRSSCNPFTRRACRAAGFEPTVVAETDDHHVLQRLVAEGVGAALESELSLRDLRSDVAVRPLTTQLRRRVFALHRRGAGAATTAFVDALQGAARPRLHAVADPVEAA